MRARWWFLVICAGAALGVFALWGAGRPLAARAESPARAAVDSPETWKAGVTLEASAAYAQIAGRLMTEAAAFRSASADSIYFVFPAPAEERTVQSVRYYLLDRTGSYSGSATMTLEVFDFAGTAHHTVSAASVDLQAAPAGAWSDFALSAVPEDLVIAPGQFLAVHFTLNGGVEPDLDARPIFDVIVQ